MSRVALEEGIERLRRGEVLLLDTDTLPGLHVLATSDGAEALARTKGHREARPWLLLVESAPAALRLGSTRDPSMQSRLESAWPGPLTALLVPRPETPVAWAHEGRRVGVRVPAHAPLRTLLGALEAPLFSTSANPAGADPARTLQEAEAAFPGLPAVDLGLASPGTPSTIVDFTVSPPKIVRQGIVGFDTESGASPSG